MAHPVQKQIAVTVSPHCNTTRGVVEVVHGLAWNMLCVLNAVGMSQSEIMDCVSNSINRAAIALEDMNRRDNKKKGKHTHGIE